MKSALFPAYSDKIYAVLRIVAGFMFLCHGLQKTFGMFGGVRPDGGTAELMTMAGIGGIIELVGGLMIMVGFLGGWAAFICSGQMAVAYFMFHQPDGALPIQNHGETAALYSFVFLFMAARGSGPWSVDAFLASRSGKKGNS